jgi:hypothetical protein
MASTNPDLASRIQATKDSVAALQNQRAESRARAESQSNHSRQGSNASGSVAGSEGKAQSDRGGGTGATPVASRERTPPTGAAGKGRESPEAIEEEEESSAADDEAVASPRQTQPRAPSRQSGSTPTQNQAGSSSRTNDGNRRQTSRRIRAVDHDLTDAQAALIDELQDINGQDSYDALAAGIGKLKQSEYLVLPIGFRYPEVPARIVGKPDAHVGMQVTDWANIYALNKARAPEGADAKTFALLRLEAVKCGWIHSQREIAYLAPIPNSMRILAEDMAELRERAATIKMASFLVPLVAEHVFRTFGHHFISTDAANYTERYQSTFRSCLAPEISGLLPASTLYHAALHWVSPGRAREVLMAQLDGMNIPDALRIRANAAPAGTAILTTTSAILKSMAAVGLDTLFADHGNFNVTEIHRVTALVKANPPKYHKSYFAYNVAPPSAQETAALEAAKEEGIRFAPFAQAYINTYMREAALGKAQALKKHADQNPIQMRRAQNLFRALGRGDVKSVQDLFATGLGTNADVDDF